MMTMQSSDFINWICGLYGDKYDDREEDSAPGGLDWIPGKKSKHKSLAVFQHELEEKGIKLTTGKIKKILITGGCWTTERTREAGALYEDLTKPVTEGGEGMKHEEAVGRIAAGLGISPAMVCVSLPYSRVVYELENKSSNARRCDRARRKR